MMIPKRPTEKTTMKIVAYYRVSTKRQGESGLGIEGQRAAVQAYAQQAGGVIVAEYVEVESGRKSDRPKLRDAIGCAKLAGATLVVAKLDRLSRNVAFLATMMEAGVKFVAADNPAANELTIHVLAAVAQAEAKAISERTKAALAAYKARGGKLGGSRPECRNLTDDARRRGIHAAGVAVKAKADAAYMFLYAKVKEWRQAGQSYQQIADQLNADGIPTRRGGKWAAMTVLRVERRAA
jgi:DNA invertase Pin-like site-specific DNA recombinase